MMGALRPMRQLFGTKRCLGGSSCWSSTKIGRTGSPWRPVSGVRAAVVVGRRNPHRRILIAPGTVTAAETASSARSSPRSLAYALRSFAVHAEAPESQASASGSRRLGTARLSLVLFSNSQPDTVARLGSAAVAVAVGQGHPGERTQGDLPADHSRRVAHVTLTEGCGTSLRSARDSFQRRAHRTHPPRHPSPPRSPA